MSVTTAFMPQRGQNQNLTAGTANATATIPRSNQLRITVLPGGSGIYVYDYSAGNASAVRPATTADYYIAAGQTSILTKSMSHDTIAFITDTGTASFKVIPGEGM